MMRLEKFSAPVSLVGVDLIISLKILKPLIKSRMGGGQTDKNKVPLVLQAQLAQGDD
jgi:hypothetical protein